MVDMLEVVDKLEAASLIRPFRQSGDWYTIYCPFHNNGQEKKPSCGILLRDQVRNGQTYTAGMFHCFSCGASYSLASGITKILEQKSINSDGMHWLEANIPGFSAENIDRDLLVPAETMTQLMNKFAAENLKARFQAQPKFISEEELASYRFTVPYMYERKLTDAVIAKYDVGFDRNHIPPSRKNPLPCITFPVRDINGHTLFIVRRSIEGKYYNYPRDVIKPVYGLYELPDNCKSIIICESIINCLTCVTYGYNAVALLGTGTPYQIEHLRRLGVREYVLCLDGDEAGRRGVARLKRGLKGSGFTWVMTVPEGEDVNSITREQFEEAYAAKE